MCGRYVSISTPDQLVERFGAAGAEDVEFTPRYNTAPTNQVPVIVDRDGTRMVTTMRWGLVPYWSKSLTKGPRPINARVETIAEKSMFKEPFAERRVLLPADGFYEWQPRGEGAKKQPWLIEAADGAPLAIAGIWGSWRDRESDERIESTCILTREAAGRMVDLHDRMPVVLPEPLWATWLEATPQDAPYLHDVIASAGVPALVARTVTDRVNNVRNEGPELIEPGTVDA